MLGVVVWSKESAQAAVIWCEDHGEIAYLKGYHGLAEQPDYTSADPLPPRWPAIGDLVTLEIGTTSNLRLARNVSVIEAEWGPALPRALQDAARGLEVTRAGVAVPRHMSLAPEPADRDGWRPVPPAFPPAPFAPVAVHQGLMPPEQDAEPPAAAPEGAELPHPGARLAGGGRA